MKSPRTLVLLFFCVLPLACHSTSKGSDVPCVCGQAAADFEGCAHKKCVKGERNPDNPDCVCGSLSIPK